MPLKTSQSKTRYTETQLGVMAGISAYFLWGLTAYYFSIVPDANPTEINANRAIWSVPIALIVLLFMGRVGDILPALKNPRIMLKLALTTSLMAINWGVYLWALDAGRASEASLGFFINPLLNVVVGVIVLSERLTWMQTLAVTLAATGVIYQTVSIGAFPWLAILLGMSFSIYGYLRKTVDIGPAQGFLIEASLLAVIAIGWFIWRGNTGVFFNSPTHALLLVGCGAMTAAPLILFSIGVKRLKLSTIGLLQYIAPSMIFLTAIFLLGEQLRFPQLVCFILIWTALVIYSWSAITEDRRSDKN